MISGSKPIPAPAPLAAERISLNQRTLGPEVDLATAVEAAVAAGFGAISPWRVHVEAVGRKQAGRMIRDAGLKVSGLCSAGFFGPGARPEDGREARHDMLEAIEDAAELAAATIVTIGGGVGADGDMWTARERLEAGLAGILDDARAAGVRVGLEPLHPMVAADRGCISTIAYALELATTIDPVGDAFGVVLDAYHVWWEPHLAASVACCQGRIDAVHVCDWRVPTRDLVLDRGLPGDGVAQPRRLRALAEAAGYAGLVEVEVFQRDLWALKDPDKIAAAAMAATLAHG